ncbi:MAG: response regulator [Gammaproteobacteria bacterium]
MKKALIVDDSRLARAVLSRLLTAHGVATDTAESAEIALDYLKNSRPDVVFLDHNMPGIDGFQALEAIKKNPATATIPVMMYTSEEGEIYLGQARALGALGVLPKTMQSVEVKKVLRSLHLIPDAAAPHSAEPNEDAARALESSRGALLDAERMRQLLEEVFHMHASALRDEMRREFRRLAPTLSAPASEPPATEPVRDERRFKIGAGLLFVVAAVLGTLYFATRSSLDAANELTQRLAADAATLAAATAAVPVTASAVGAEAVGVSGNVLEILEWGLNQGGRFPFGAVPLDDGRAVVIDKLTAELERIGFAGTVAIDVHVGRFCMNYRTDGMLVLALPEQPVATCEQVGWAESEAIAIGRQQTRAFANAVASAMARDPQIEIETASVGTSQASVDYPPLGFQLTAGVWNAAAAANQRVSVRLLPRTRSSAIPDTQ